MLRASLVTADEPNGLPDQCSAGRPSLTAAPGGEGVGSNPRLFTLSSVCPSLERMTLLGLARYSISRPSAEIANDGTSTPGNGQVPCLRCPVAVLMTPSPETLSNGRWHAEVT